MSNLTKTVKLHIRPDEDTKRLLGETAHWYMCACNYVSRDIFDSGITLNIADIHDHEYKKLRKFYGLGAQMAQSVIRTVAAKYKAVREQMRQKPYTYKDETGRTQYIKRTPEWLQEPILFKRPQADFVRDRNWSFADGGTKLSLGTLEGRAIVEYDAPECFAGYFDGSWRFGTGKLVELGGEWYFHVSVAREAGNAVIDGTTPVVGVDLGLRFMATAFDDDGKTTFFSGSDVMKKRDRYAKTRAGLQARGTKSAKRALKRMSGRENRWMACVNHRLSKTLCGMYAPGTLFVLEDLAGVSFDRRNLRHGGSARDKDANRHLRSWPFYQFGQFLEYKAKERGQAVIHAAPQYTSQRCPKCGRIHKDNRDHEKHEYVCDMCGYRSNDDRVGAMNLHALGKMYANGNKKPRFLPGRA